MNDLEKTTVKTVAKLAPWLAPMPSAYFVARAGIAHLGLPIAVAVIAAAIIETLDLSTVDTSLWLSDYNVNKRKTDPTALSSLDIPKEPAIVQAGEYLESLDALWDSLTRKEQREVLHIILTDILVDVGEG